MAATPKCTLMKTTVCLQLLCDVPTCKDRLNCTDQECHYPSEACVTSLSCWPLTRNFLSLDDGDHGRVGNKAAQGEIAQAKVLAPSTALAVIDAAMQAFGAEGVSQDTMLAYAWAGARTLRLADGPDEVGLGHLESIGQVTGSVNVVMPLLSCLSFLVFASYSLRCSAYVYAAALLDYIPPCARYSNKPSLAYHGRMALHLASQPLPAVQVHLQAIARLESARAAARSRL
jgi:hypothetical protein